jgi:uncharacterized Zn-finger protein
MSKGADESSPPGVSASGCKAACIWEVSMVSHEEELLHVHNNPGLARVRIRAKEFMCVGDLPPFDHPHIFINMGDDAEIVCPYCATLFVYDPQIQGICEPPECEYHTVPEPEPPPSDISIVTPPTEAENQES